MRTALALLLLAATFQAIPQDEPGSIEGAVIRADSGVPIPGALVRLSGSRSSGGALSLETTTDGAGRFSFRGVPDGTFRVEASADGFVYRDLTSTQWSASFRLSPDRRRHTANLALVATATIHGRVLDNENRGVEGIAVEVLHTSMDEYGRRFWERDGVLRTNDQGEYRQSGLQPGEYYVRTLEAKAGGPRIIHYFPGTPEASAASTVALRDGEETIADIRIPSASDTATFKISGKIIHSLNRTANSPSISVILVNRNSSDPVDRSIASNFSARGIADDHTGDFELSGVSPGAYDLFAQTAVGPNAYLSKTPVDVGSEDIIGLPVPLGPGVDVTAKLTVIDTSSVSGFSFAPPLGYLSPASGNDRSIDIRLERKDGFSFSPPFIVDETRTSVTFPNVPEGEYRVLVSLPTPVNRELKPDAYIEDVRIGGRSVYDDGIRVGVDAVDSLEVVVGTAGGVIEGTVPGKGRVDAELILIPDIFRRQNPGLYRRVLILSSNEDGAFLMRGVPPGDYKIFAVTGQTGSIPYRSAEFAASYEARAASVTVRKGTATSSVLVPLIR